MLDTPHRPFDVGQAVVRGTPMSPSQVEKEIVDALKQCLDAYGPITRQNLLSANKRVRPVGSDE